MKALLDTCVLYPTVLREILLGVARKGLYDPFWSPRILDEWRHVSARRDDATLAEAEIALLGAQWPDALISPDPAVEAKLWLRDAADIHVLAAAMAAEADVLLTLNLRDFPAAAVAPHGVRARHPDPFLCDCLSRQPVEVAGVVEVVRAKAEHLSGVPQPMRPLLKRARLPRLARALERL